MADADRPQDQPEPEVYRYQIDVIVLAKSSDEADQAIRFRGPHILRSVKWSCLRSATWTDPAWSITRDGDMVEVKPKRKPKPKLGEPGAA